MKKVLLIISMAIVSELDVRSAGATATMIQHVSTFSNYDPSQAGNPYFISLPNQTGAGNALILGISYPFAAGRTVTVSDDQTNVWTLGPSTSPGPTEGEMVSRLYYTLNVAPGTQKITIRFDSSLYNFQAVVTEFYNVAQVEAADGNSENSDSSAPAVSAGSFATAAAGDLIYFYALDSQPTDTLTGFTPAPGFTLLSADVMLGWLAQYAIQTNAGPINPAVTVIGGSDSFNAVALALKSASAGTGPNTGIRIVRVCHVNWRRRISFPFPSSGNLIVCNSAQSQATADIAGMASEPTNTWIEVPTVDYSDQIWYAPNAKTSPGVILTPSVTGSFSVSLVLYDVTGADPAPYDEGAGVALATMENLDNSAPLLEMPVIKPTTSNGLIFAVMNNGEGPTTGMVGEGLTLDTITYGDETDNDVMDNADGYAHCYNATTQAVSFGWIMNSSPLPDYSIAVGTAFKAAVGLSNLRPSLSISWLTNGGGSVLVSGIGLPVRSYTVEFTPNLENPNWQELGTVMADNSGSFSYADTASAAVGTRFYRAVMQ